MAAFIPRLTKPEAGNPYYNRKARGGYSPCIKGSPTDAGCDVLSNCVGYAIGRFNEIGGWGCCKYLRSTNAENFLQVANGLEIGKTPRVGAVIVWRKGATLSGSDGAGHVAIVEQVNADGSIVTSESGWGCAPFWIKTRKKGSGNWGAGSGYTFLGFIYNPAPCCGGSDTSEAPEVETKPDKVVDDSEYTLADFIEAVQQVTGSEVDGIAGNETIRNTPTLSRWYNRKHPAVLAVQLRLQALGYNLGKYGADGVYGKDTADAVKAYQSANGCEVDGVITKRNKTWRKLLGMK